MFKSYLYLLIIQLIHHQVASWFTFLPQQCEMTEEADEIVVYNDNYTEEIDNHLSNQCCSCKYVKFINPYETKARLEDTVSDKSLPVCLKCAMCLAVAETMNKLFKVIETGIGKEHPEFEQKSVEVSFEYLAKNGFRNHDLRNYNGYGIISTVSKSSTHIRTAQDGKWTLMLRKMCKTFINHMDLFEVYSQFKNGNLNITDYLCRGDGIFRECNNIHFETVPVEHKNKKALKYWVRCLLS